MTEFRYMPNDCRRHMVDLKGAPLTIDNIQAGLDDLQQIAIDKGLVDAQTVWPKARDMRAD